VCLYFCCVGLLNEEKTATELTFIDKMIHQISGYHFSIKYLVNSSYRFPKQIIKDLLN